MKLTKAWIDISGNEYLFETDNNIHIFIDYKNAAVLMPANKDAIFDLIEIDLSKISKHVIKFAYNAIEKFQQYGGY